MDGKHFAKEMLVKQFLIVDDDASITVLLSEALEAVDKGCIVFTAENGHAAVDILRSRHPDVLVTDLNMPDMDGYDLIAYTRAYHPHMTVFAMSGEMSPEAAKRVRSLGVAAFFEKPFDLLELVVQLVDQLGERSTWRDPAVRKRLLLDSDRADYFR